MSKVKRWQDRYSAMQEELRKVEKETPHKLGKTIKKILSDAQRPGGSSKFSDEQVALIIVIACENQAKFELPFSHWTPSLLRIEVIKKGIVDDISARQIGRFFKRKRSKKTGYSLI